jgi:quercetin dioxygenase-like cupin family protein
MKKIKSAWLALILIPVAFAFAAIDEDGFVRLQPEDMEWHEQEDSPASYVYLAGDSNEEGFYMIRAKFPPGVMSSPHYHTTDRHVTVISGTWYTGTGEDFDKENMIALKPGSYMMHPAGGVHYDGSKGEEVIVEIKGVGPNTTVR